MKKLLLIIILLLLPSLVLGEIHKHAHTCPNSAEICFYWWPKLPSINGWSQDAGSSYHYRMNAQAPEDQTFSSAEVVIYGKAEYIHENSAEKTLKDFITFSQRQFSEGAPSPVKIVKTGEFASAEKHTFSSYSFHPEAAGNWEQVSYAEDKDIDGNQYFIILVLSARSQASFDNNIATYNEFISKYGSP